MIHAKRENPNPKTKTAQTSFCFTLEFLETKNWVFGNKPHAEHAKFLKLSETASFSFYIGISEQFLGAERALSHIALAMVSLASVALQVSAPPTLPVPSAPARSLEPWN